MSSDSDEENAVRYGTPLEPYEEDEIPSKRKYQQQPDQYAVDEHGRRRFHGAFTGGFSAGFGNTVGTAEGWTPTSFKSSRSEKSSFSNQRPEDFMDDEDRGEHGIAPWQMHTQNEFSGQKRTRQQRFHDGPIPGVPVLEQLVRAVHETAAVRMLKAMGWRDGQGAGDRLSKQEKKRARDQHRVYGCYMPPELRQETEQEDDGLDSESDSEFDYETLFAPDDYEPYILNRKNDRFGLGYSGLSRHSVLGNLMGEYGSEVGTSKSHLVMKEKGKKVSIRGQAFGVGAFEADDEDIYATEDMSHYDFALGGLNNDKQKKPVKDTERNVLQGFVKSNKPLPSVPSYPPPALPRDYVPLAAGARRTRFEPTTQVPRDQGLGRHELTAEARGELLGEPPLPKQIEINKETDKQNIHKKQIENTTDDAIVKAVNRTISFTSTVSTELDYIPIKDSGKELIKVFKPFVSDPKKQARYEKYVKDKDSAVWERDAGDKLSEWEMNREMAEFEQAAKLYKPLSGVMGDRFTHASQPDEAINPLTAVAKSTTNYGLATAEQMAAAEKGVYGVMTRRETPWRPEGLVCKRFNVPEVGGPRLEQKKEDKPKVSYSIFSYLETSVHDKDSFAKEQSKFSGSKSLDRETLTKPDQNNAISYKKTVNDHKETVVNTNDTGFNKRMTVAEMFLKESENDMSRKETLAEVTETINKFDKMDLYKAIFLSDSEEEVEEAEKGRNNDASEFIDRPRNIERNTSPPRGIFANIDFDELNSWRRNVNDKVEEKATQNIEGGTKVGKESDTEAVYGPKIPDNLKKRLESETAIQNNNAQSNDVQEIGSSSSDSWVDAREVKSKKQKKKKSKKHKASKHKKSKHKKKDR